MSCSSSIAKGASWAPCWLQEILVWLSEHQVIFAALIALGSASVTIYYIRRQISQAHKFHEDELTRIRKAGLTSGAILGADVCDYFLRAKRHIDEVCGRFDVVDPQDLWESLGDTIAFKEMPRSFSEDEVAAFASSKEAPLLMEISEMRRAVEIDRQFWRSFSELRLKAESLSAGKAIVSKDDKGIVRSVEVNPEENPDLHLVFLRLRDASVQYNQFTEELSSRAVKVFTNISSMCKNQKLDFKLELPEYLTVEP
jgi:hypothetical protein